MQTTRSAAAATAVGKPGSPAKTKKKQPCPSEGCSSDHLLFKCSKFRDMSVPERKVFIKKIGACLLCLQKGHRVADCPRADKLGSCTIDSCNQPHNSLLHESVASGQVAAVYESQLFSKNNFMVML